MNKLNFSINSIILGLIFSATVSTFTVSIPTKSLAQVTNVSQLRDISPTNWAYEALRSLSDRYGCIVGFPNRTYKRNQALTRYEFAAGLNACLNQIEGLITQNETVLSEDLEIIQRLSQDFVAELATIDSRISDLANRIAYLEDNQFSTTTKLSGQAVFALNAGGYTGERIIDPNGNLITDDRPQATLLYRTNLDLDTSFNGTDNLKIRLDSGSNGSNDNTGGLLEPNFGSILDISNSPPRDDELGIGRAYYSFQPIEKLEVALGPIMVATDFIDFNSQTLPSFINLSTESLGRNYILFPISGPTAGVYTAWTFGDNKLTIRAAYNAADANNPSNNTRGLVPGLTSFTSLLYPDGEGESGLFGDFYQGLVELEYFPLETLALRLQYSGGEVFDHRFNVFGVNVEWQFLSKLAVFGRYGYGSYDKTAFGDIDPNYWMTGIAVIDLFKEGTRLGVAAGQPFIANEIGDDTQTNFEAFYNFPVNDNIAIAPILQVINNASNQNSNDTIITGTIRTVFSW